MTLTPEELKKFSFDRRVPVGDNRERLVCRECEFIFYENPKIVVGAVVTASDGRVLLCRRAIEPARGLWTIPAGYMELGETPEQGACREAHEEACARIETDGLLAVYSIARISQVLMIYRARLAAPDFSAGEESLEARLFAWSEIPWNELAFPTVSWALRDFKKSEGSPLGQPSGNPRP